MDIAKKVKQGHDNLIVNKNHYKILKDFRGTYIEKEMQSEEMMAFPIFRVFEPAKPERFRKLNIDPTHEFDPFNDSLMDYASIISYKLKKPWRLFNRLISVHIPLCPNDCWYCYLPKELYVGVIGSEERYDSLTAVDIVKRFLIQRDTDQQHRKDSNVLRLTGGEPFLLPELILECLDIIKDDKLDDDIFLWTETNLEPFLGEDGKAFIDEDRNKSILNKLGHFKNFLVHPCFHGLSAKEFNITTGKDYYVNLDQQIKGLKRLIDAGIDVYPTFGSNVCDPSNIEDLFNKLKDLHPHLPLKVALVEYRCDYEPVGVRLNKSSRTPSLYSRFASIRIWNQLLLKNFGVGYGILPRHLVSINKEPLLEIASDFQSKAIKHGEEIIYFFKSSDRELYHREVLDYLSLPQEHIVELFYDKRHVQDDLFFHMSKIPEMYEGRKAIFSYVNSDNRTLLPFRIVEIVQVSGNSDVLMIKLKLKEFISFPKSEAEDLAKSITQALKNYFGSKTLPLDGKYILLGEHMLFDDKLEKKINLSQAFNLVEDEVQIGNDGEDFRRIIPHLIKNTRMNHSIFYRIQPEGIKIAKNDDYTLYEIKGGKSFKINIEFFLPNYGEFDEGKPEQRTILVKSSNPTIAPIGPTKTVCSRYGRETLYFRTESVRKKEEISLTFYAQEDQFMAAKAIIRISVLPQRRETATLSAIGATILIITTYCFTVISKALTEIKDPFEIILDPLIKFWNQASLELIIKNGLIFILPWFGLWFIFWLNYSGIHTKVK